MSLCYLRFVGCIKGLKYAEGYEKLVQRSPRTKGSKTLNGCYNYCNKEDSTPKCGKGKCINRFTSYTCECFGSGYEGKNCQKGIYEYEIKQNKLLRGNKGRLENKARLSQRTRTNFITIAKLKHYFQSDNL